MLNIKKAMNLFIW